MLARKALVAVGVFTAASISAVAGTCTWTGLGDGTSWSQLANWDSEALPADGDSVVIANKSGKPLTVTLGEDVSVGAIKISGATTADTVTLTGAGGLTVTAEGGWSFDGALCPFYVLGPCSITMDVPLTIPVGVNLQIGRGGESASQPPLTFDKAIRGAGGLTYHIGWQSCIVLNAENSYEGGTTIAGGGKTYDVDVNAASPFGQNKTVNMAGGCIDNYAGGTFDYNLVLSSSGKATLRFRKNTTLTGTITGDDARTGLLVFDIEEDRGVVVTVDAELNTPEGQIQPYVKPNDRLVFNQKVTCQRVEAYNGGEGPQNGQVHFGCAGNAIAELWVGSSYIYADVPDAFDANTVVNFMGTYLGDKGAVFDLNGKDQTLGRIVSVVDAGGQCCKGHILRSQNDARVLVKPEIDALTTCVINDKVTFVLDAAESFVTQVLSNRVNSMSGDFVVSNGQLRIAGAASFVNVKKLEIVGGTFDSESTTALALAGVTDVIIGEGAMLKVGVTSPFATVGVKIHLEDETGRISIADGVDLSVDAVYIGDEPLDGDLYSGNPTKGRVVDQIVGNGTIYVSEVEVPTKSMCWVGLGSDANVTSLDNWGPGMTTEDLTSRGLYPTFAENGTEAICNQPVKFKGIVFDIPGGQQTNVFTVTGVGPISLYDLGLTVASPATEEIYRYVTDVPMQFKKPQVWNLSADEDVTLSIDKPISGNDNLTVSGKGALELRAESADYNGVVSLSCAQTHVYAARDAFGKASDAQVELHASDDGAALFLHGTTIEKPILWNQLSTVGITAVEGVNVLTKKLTINTSSKSPVISVAADAELRLEEEWTQSDALSTYMWTAHKYGDGLLSLNKRARAAVINVFAGTLSIGARCMRYDGIDTSYDFKGPARIVFTGSYMKSDYSPVKFNDSGTFDLGGYDQQCGDIYSGARSVRGQIYSEQPATLSSCIGSASDMLNTDVAGAVSMVFRTYGDKVRTNSINAAISTVGTLSISNNAVIVMSENASWLNPTSGVVSVADNGVLAINRSKTFSRRLDFALAGDGRIELAAGVVQRCANLYLDDSDSPAELGTWGATGSGAKHIDDRHFVGKGVLDVRGKDSGLVLIFR